MKGDPALQLRIEELQRKLEEANQLVQALASGEVDAVARRESLTPVLLHAAQENLRANEQLLRAVFDGAMDAMIIADGDGRCVHANRATGALLGIEPERILGRTLGDFAEVPADHARDWERLLLEGQLETSFRLRRPDGGVRDTELRALAPILPGLTLFVLRDITERRRIELRFQTMFERSHEGVALATREGKVIFSSPGLDRMRGPSVTSSADEDAFAAVHPDDREELRATFAAVVARPGTEVSASYRLLLEDGSTRWRAATYRNFLHEPAIAAVVVNVRDVTDRRAARATLEETQKSLEEAQAIAHVGSWALTPGVSATISWSAECARIFGRDVNEPPTIDEFMAMVHPDDRAAVDAARVESIARGEIFSSEHRVLLHTGETRWVHTRTRRESTPSSRSNTSREGAAGVTRYRAVGAIQDITDRRQAEEARRRLASIVASSDDAIISCDPDGIVQSWNGGAERLTLHSAAEAIGQPISVLYAPEESVRLASDRGVANEGRRLEQYEMAAVRKDGSRIEVSVTASALLDESGRNQGTSIIARDVSERRRSEAALRRSEDQLRQAQKMEAIGSLAGALRTTSTTSCRSS